MFINRRDEPVELERLKIQETYREDNRLGRVSLKMLEALEPSRICVEEVRVLRSEKAVGI